MKKTFRYEASSKTSGAGGEAALVCVKTEIVNIGLVGHPIR